MSDSTRTVEDTRAATLRTEQVGKHGEEHRRTRRARPEWVGTLVLSFALSTVLTGCSFQASVKAGGDAKSANDAPPPATPAGEPASEPAQPAPATHKVKVNGAKLEVEGSVTFQPDSAVFAPGGGSEAVLNEIKAYLEQNPRVTRLRIEGHTHNQRPADQSLQLSGQRAQAVKQWLRTQGIHEGRLLAVGFGDTRPIASNADPSGQAQNERIAFRIAELDGKPYLGPDPLAGGTEFP